ncbi:baseplate multidomain protein megatron [Paracoccus spongiarum]|uniref:Glycoside hydrolase TIM-barrel-like domain-containing protein n=1 Tax=Paracoccus spongiarum TaxID=3064387 RepID=A0ABT9JF93_9RHOB|nr:glycoside hydrolase TIM-barrel-like domain-containing protein [Paracoccus sp. 2205BS29-5]MDP5308429.1 glycoside hydrolase TIM-barrel-like domain-containing protein [Paracoccus sp. 2205BS29-5]
MATLVLASVGATIGGGFGGAILGFSGAAIGGMIGSTIGAAVDSWIVSSLAPAQRIEGARLDNLRITASTEGAVIPRIFGRMRMGGNIFWATDFREETKTSRQGGGKGGGPKVEATEYLYYASFAVALCEGEITGIGRIWADGKPLDTSGLTWRWYPGSETQQPDPFIAVTMGVDQTPAFRGTAYVVFEDLPLSDYGNRLPQLSFEVFRPLADPDTAEGLTRAVTLIPASGEFTYATEPVRKGGRGETTAENLNATPGSPDMIVALDRLQAMAPKVESVSLVVAWFGNDLRCGHCTIRPGVEVVEKASSPKTWSVNGVSRDQAHLVSRDGRQPNATGSNEAGDERPVYGGTPADFAVVQAIREMKARGLRVTFYPFILMDVPPGNVLPDPYSDHAAGMGQPAFPWRGRITCSPAAGQAGSVDKTATAGDQVGAFFGSASVGDFTVTGDEVRWTGNPSDHGLRRMALHYAHLCAAAGGVDAFLIGSEMRGLTTIRAGANAYPAVAALRALAADVRAILGPTTKISYAADWSEYFGHQPGDGSGDVFFHLDPLWADESIDFIGIDNYLPLSDWRDGFDHLDAQAGWPAIHHRTYLQSNIAGGEGYDWFYATEADRAAQVRTPITDGAQSKPWVFRPKDILGWWSNRHFDRPSGVEAAAPTAWLPESKPIRFTELGCPAIDRGTNQPNVFYDPKSSESFVPYFSRGWRDDAIQRAYLEATYLHWGKPANNPVSTVTGQRMVDVGECAAWTWDARPYPFFPALSDVWTDGANWRLGHWLTGRLGAVSLAALIRHICLRAELPEARIDVSGLWGAAEGYAITALESPRASITMLARHFGFDAVESEGLIRFVMRGRAPVSTIRHDDLVAGNADGEAFELTRAQETELPQALKWQVARADEDYDAALVEASRITVDTSRIASESFPMAVPPEEAERRCRRALQEAWAGRESAAFRLPPSKLALDPADVIALDRDGRQQQFRLTAIADAQARGIEAVRQDREAYDLPPGAERPATLPRAVTFGPPEVVILDLPQLRDDIPAHQPLIAATAKPWPGALAVYRSPGTDGFELVTTVRRRANLGRLASKLWPGPTSRFDLGNVLILDLASGQLDSVSDLALFSGANAMAVETAPGRWEIVQAGHAELIAPGRYRLTRLLRGQRGTEQAMGHPSPAGARVVMLNEALTPLPILEADLGIPFNWRIGPARYPGSSDTFTAISFTPEGAGLRPFLPVHIDQPWRHPHVPGDLPIRWTRRSRSLVADSWQGMEVPLGEELERYEVRIMDGAVVKRTLTSDKSSVTYTAAQQVTDWGAELAPGDSVRLRICQLSARIGRGTARMTTLYL